MKKVCILGAGAWGAAVATVLAHNGHSVVLWCHNPSVARDITMNKCNERFLPGVQLDAQITATTNMQEAMQGAHFIFEAIPVQFLREVLQQAHEFYAHNQILVVLSKGIERQTLMLPSQIMDDIFGVDFKKAVVVGPSFAKEVAACALTGVCVASSDDKVAAELQSLLHNDYFRVYKTLDVIGVQIGAALKNVMALGVGLLDGSGYKDNTKAFFITRGLNEIKRVALALGAQEATLYGLSGLGDLILTGTGRHSRNLDVGRRIGAGNTLQQALDESGHTAEGANTVQSLNALAAKLNISLPICSAIHRVLFENIAIKDALRTVLDEALEWEFE